jgi:hypothetical protein
MPVSISGDGTFAGLTSVETINVLHPDAVDPNIVLSDDGSVALDSIPASIQSAIDAAGNAGIGLNVVQTVKADTFTTTSDTIVDITGLAATITPSSATAKVLVLWSLNVGQSDVGDGGLVITLTDGSDNVLVQGDAASGRNRSIFGFRLETSLFTLHNVAGSFLWSPGSASAVTAKLRMRRASAGTAFVNRTGNDSDNANFPRTVSIITLVEVAA